jgi:hypothetical protein
MNGHLPEKVDMTTKEIKDSILTRLGDFRSTNHHKISVTNRSGKIYVKSIGVDKTVLDLILTELTNCPGWDDFENRKFWLTSGSWPAKDFTFRILVP